MPTEARKTEGITRETYARNACRRWQEQHQREEQGCQGNERARRLGRGVAYRVYGVRVLVVVHVRRADRRVEIDEVMVTASIGTCGATVVVQVVMHGHQRGEQHSHNEKPRDGGCGFRALAEVAGHR